MADSSNNPSGKSPDELKKMAEEIRRNVLESLKPMYESLQKKLPVETSEALTLEVDTLSPTERSVAEPSPSPVRGDDAFWDLGKPKPRVYTKATFSDNSLSVTDVGSSLPETDLQNTAQAEKILPREAYVFRDKETARRPADNIGSSGRTVNTINGPRSIPDNSGSVVTGSYRRKSPTSRKPTAPRKPAEIVKDYTPSGILLRNVVVRTWETDVEFYGRFASDALQSHRASPKSPISADLSPVPYFSYVPQYSHMNGSQIEYYRWVRECIRNGKYPPCDLPYIQLYIFEIINLPNEILPEDGVHLLAAIWLNYRKQHPRLDGYLCEWFADYCLIGGCSIPKELLPILYEIVPKAQFKEFYLNNISADSSDLGKTVLEVSSDYDYRRSRYYTDNKAAYESYIPTAVTAVLKESYKQSRGIFAMDRCYRMTRDSFCGAIASSGIKRRLDIEFLSFTRRADTRQTVTSIAKYTENKLRTVLGIKAKLGIDRIAPEDAAFLDSFFEPLIPSKQKKAKEDLYMPDDYMKNYESEDSGFDFAAAQAIEAQSWLNTGRLTGDETMIEDAKEYVPLYDPDEAPIVEGEIHSDSLADEIFGIEAFDSEEIPPQSDKSTTESNVSTDNADYTSNADNADYILKEALNAALVGRFKVFCRSHELHEGEIADRINNIFLEEMGDIVLENSGGGFELIEDYREDVENWLS